MRRFIIPLTAVLSEIFNATISPFSAVYKVPRNEHLIHVGTVEKRSFNNDLGRFVEPPQTLRKLAIVISVWRR